MQPVALWSGIYLPPGWVTLQFYLQNEGWIEAAGSVTLTHMTCGLEKLPEALSTTTPHSFAPAFQRQTEPLHKACVFSCQIICILFIHIFDLLSMYSVLFRSPLWSLKWEERKEVEEAKVLFFQAQCLQATCLHSSVTSLHTCYDTPFSSGARCHHLAASRGWLGARWVSPRYLWGATLALTDRLTGTHTHSGLIQTHFSCSTPAHMLPSHDTLCIKQWLYIHFFRHKIIFSPL